MAPCDLNVIKHKNKTNIENRSDLHTTADNQIMPNNIDKTDILEWQSWCHFQKTEDQLPLDYMFTFTGRKMSLCR